MKECNNRISRIMMCAALIFFIVASGAFALTASARVVYPTEYFSHSIATSVAFSSWSLVSLPEWVRMPASRSGGPADIAIFKVEWSMIPYGPTGGSIELVLNGTSEGTTAYTINLTLTKADPAATPTPEILGTPLPTLPAMVTFKGHVYTGDSFAAISGAMITISGDSRTASATSAPDGSYWVGLAAGSGMDVSLSVNAFEYISQSYDFKNMLSEYDHDFALYDIMSGTPAPTAVPVIRGDLNGDGAITIVDALLASQCYIGLRPQVIGVPDPCDASRADVDCNGAVTIVDALKIAQFYVGLLSSFPC